MNIVKVREWLGRLTDTAKTAVSGFRGSSVSVFCIFLGVSALLWFALTLNEEVQRELRCQIRIVNCPDSMVRVTRMPEALNASISGGGIPLHMKISLHAPVIEINYATYERQGVIELGRLQLMSLVSKTLGQEAVVQNVSPDSLRIAFTSFKPRRMPVTVDARISTLPNCALTGPVTASVDSVWLYSLTGTPSGMRSVSTVPVDLSDVSGSMTMRVPLSVPAGCRAVPDSVDLRIRVEPMISRTLQVPVTVTGVPQGMRMIVIPSAVNVSYTMPMSKYNDTPPRFSVTADYRTLPEGLTSNKIGVKLRMLSGSCTNVYLSSDSVEYILERH